jgi:hypothetical protein
MGDPKNEPSSGDIEVVAPDGATYRVCSRRRGEPLRRWDGVDTAFAPLDLVIFAASLTQRAVTAVRVRTRRGWTVGVLRDTGDRWQVVHRENVDNDRLRTLRVAELVQAVGDGSVTR